MEAAMSDERNPLPIDTRVRHVVQGWDDGIVGSNERFGGDQVWVVRPDIGGAWYNTYNLEIVESRRFGCPSIYRYPDGGSTLCEQGAGHLGQHYATVGDTAYTWDDDAPDDPPTFTVTAPTGFTAPATPMYDLFQFNRAPKISTITVVYTDNGLAVYGEDSDEITRSDRTHELLRLRDAINSEFDL
jgi:hypothetical protein